MSTVWSLQYGPFEGGPHAGTLCFKLLADVSPEDESPPLKVNEIFRNTLVAAKQLKPQPKLFVIECLMDLPLEQAADLAKLVILLQEADFMVIAVFLATDKPFWAAAASYRIGIVFDLKKFIPQQLHELHYLFHGGHPIEPRGMLEPKPETLLYVEAAAGGREAIFEFVRESARPWRLHIESRWGQFRPIRFEEEQSDAE